jgi:hypothetical protein
MEEIDLFENYKSCQLEVQKILLSEYDNENYRVWSLLWPWKVGYTCDYYLDAIPYNLKKIITKWKIRKE